MLTNSALQSIKVSFLGPGSKLLPKAPSFSSLHPKPNTMLVHLARVISPPESVEESWAGLHKLTQRWVSAHA
jgi:hypothetical protein